MIKQKVFFVSLVFILFGSILYFDGKELKEEYENFGDQIMAPVNDNMDSILIGQPINFDSDKYMEDSLFSFSNVMENTFKYFRSVEGGATIFTAGIIFLIYSTDEYLFKFYKSMLKFFL